RAGRSRAGAHGVGRGRPPGRSAGRPALGGGGEGARGRRRARERARQPPEPRRHGLHVGGGRAPLSQARVGPRAAARQPRGPPRPAGERPIARLTPDASRLLVARGLRGWADGFVSVLLAGYLTRLGFAPVEI